ncbi:hypothetical protein SAMN04488100_1214 [Alkalibacterium putridalgicola]|uniref:Uncharacterized protein n=1 Tax=Alkalibacterium putridalgicola TaxID=426703 RepID=A0A1H7V0P5_9LACT|nr:hypothetical protein [Alkalibacterium putridalgicola]GEK89701.1 hypothetical protein APU01nite_17400 [Alkalibacterium putridalgicola]SEM02706.1 hypothetical protein SAMN04488100_1214 [Alkalibacterium putridalgicola]
MNDKLIDTIKEMEIKSAPEEQSLEAALNQYTKKQLAHFIERFDLDIAKSWKKAEIIDALIEWMESAQKELLESNEELNAFYSNKVVNADQPLEINDDLSDKEQESVLSLVEHGLVFNADGQLWAPEAVAKTFDTASNKPAESSEATEEKASQNEEKSQPAQPKKQGKQTSSPTLSPEERIAREKKMRLKYFKKQAKKKKKKR